MPTTAVTTMANTATLGTIDRHREDVARQEAEERAAEEPEREPAQSADQGDRQRLGEELADDVGAPRADREPQADLAPPFVHRHQHHVHDADAADQQRADREDDHEHVQRGEHRVEAGEDVDHAGDEHRLLVGRRDVQAAGEDLPHLALEVGVEAPLGGARDERVDVVGVGERHRRGDRDPDLLVDGAAVRG